mgnify:CR=1 FL=1
MIGVAFVLAGWFVGRGIYGYVHRFAFRLSQEIHAAYIEIYPENPPHFAYKKGRQSCVLLSLNFALFLRRYHFNFHVAMQATR